MEPSHVENQNQSGIETKKLEKRCWTTQYGRIKGDSKLIKFRSWILVWNLVMLKIQNQPGIETKKLEKRCWTTQYARIKGDSKLIKFRS